MKMSFSHKKPILVGGGILIIVSILLLFTTCDIGLGPIVNTEKPVINSAGENPPGTFLQGKDNPIALDIKNKLGFKIVEVWMDIDYTDLNGNPATKRIYAQQDPDTGEWFVNLDTTGMEDGNISGKVTAKDESGNTTTTTEMIYKVKNTPPQIKLNMPLVEGINWDNIYENGEEGFLDDLAGYDPLYLGFDIMGLATDDYGIEMGYPKIMIWPSEGTPIDLDADGVPKPSDGRYGTWRSLVVPNKKDGLTATKFTWPMWVLKEDATAEGGFRLPDRTKGEKAESVPTGKYRLRIVTKDKFGNINYYPNRTDTTTPDKPQRKFIEITYKASDVPLVNITDTPQYYNGVNPLEIFFLVSSSTPVTETFVAITDGQDGTEKVIGDQYTIESLDSDKVYKYKLTITPEQVKKWTNIPAKGQMFVRISANTADKTGPAAYQNFIFDNTPPDITIDRPVNLLNKFAAGDLKDVGGAYEILYPNSDKPKWVTGTIMVGGSAKDNFTLKEVSFHIGKLGDDKISPADRQALYTNPANWSPTNLEQTTPVAPWSGSPYSWSYTFSPFAKEYKDTPAGKLLIQEFSDLSGYSGSNSDTSGKVRFYLPFYVKVTDNAGNFRVVHYKLSVDPLLDEPQITVTQPERKKNDQGVAIQGDAGIPIVGGTVRVAGFAEDNFWMHTVLVRVRKADNSYYFPSINNTPVPAFYPAAGYPLPSSGDSDIAGWFKANTIGDSNNINWYANINQDRTLEPSASGATAKVTVEIMAIDCDESDPTHNKTHMTGPVEKWDLLFSKDVPTISLPKIQKDGILVDREYKEGIKASGKFTVYFDVDAIEKINTLTVRVNTELVNLVIDANRQNNLSLAWDVSDATPPTPPTNSFEKRKVKLTIDSLAAKIPGFTNVNGFPIGSTGNITLEVMAEDSTSNHLTTTSIYTIGIDNLYPTASITTPQVASDNLAIGKEKYFYVEGEAKDYGTAAALVQGLERVLVTFEKATIVGTGTSRKVSGSGTFVNPYTGNEITGAAIGTGFQSYPNVMDLSVSTTTASSYDKYPVLTSSSNVWKSATALVIDNNEGAAPTVDSDGDGTYGETWTTPPALKSFGARVVFQGTGINWKDGPYIVHYFIVDEAGNVTHYYDKYDIYLENNKPRITGINFGTDINGVAGTGAQGNVTDGTSGTLNEYLYYDTATGYAKNATINEPGVSSAAGVMSPSFRIRGSRFNINIDVDKGNGAKGATITYVSGQATVLASSMTKGNVYTIAGQGTSSIMTDFTKYGAPNNVPGTTFVASGPAPIITNGATVTSYTTVNRLGIPMSETQKNIILSFQDFTANGRANFIDIPDSVKYVSGDTIPSGSAIGDVKTHNERFFIVKVYDDTVPSAPGQEYDQLSDAILLKVDIDNTDSKNPSIKVLPFGAEYYVNPSLPPPMNNPANDAAKEQRLFENIGYTEITKEYTRNIGMNNVNGKEVKGGYVQYARHSDPNNANISGKVKFLGKMEDNQRIGEIWVTISNYNGGNGSGTAFRIADRNTSNGEIRPITPTGAYDGHWAFNVLENKNYFTLDYGHTLNWEFMWDSSKVDSVARSGVNIKFEIRDAAYTTGIATPTDPTHAGTDAVTVNVVPYITEIKTPLSGAYSSNPSAFNRSALGGYPVREGDSITISGFNLGSGTANNATSSVTIGGGNLTVNARDNNTITAIVPTSTVSGALLVTVNGITSFNNRSNRSKSGGNWDSPYTAYYNQEPNNVNNNILDNSRYVYVWSTGYLIAPTGTAGTTGGAGTGYVTPANTRNPFMRMDSNANRYITFGWHNGTNSELRVVKNVTNTKIEQEVNRYINNTIAFDSYGDWYAASSNTTSSATYYFNLYARAAVNDVNANHNNQDRDNKRRLSGVGSNSDRFKVPRIAVMSTNGTAKATNNNAARIYMSYYDSDDKDLIFHFGTVGADNNFGQDIATSNSPTKRLVVDHASTNASHIHKGSIYSAVGYLSTGRPVIAWYDDTNSCLVFSYGNSAPSNTAYTNANNTVTTTTDQWQANARRVTPVGSGQGLHVDMAVDGDNIHLAYYDVNNGGLYYAYIPSANVVSNSAATYTYKVDTYLSAGTKIMLNVRSGVPYITYYHGAFTDTKNSIRVAWRKEPLPTGTLLGGTDDGNKFTGMWEVMTVPVGTVPLSGEFVCNGVPTANTGWTAANVPDGSTLKENANTLRYSNLNQSILLGYFTQNHYEGAVLKGDMSTSWNTLVGK